jgi:uncharacterized protein YceK
VIGVARRLCVVALVASTSGCGTLLSMGMNHAENPVLSYGGTRADILLPLVALRIIPVEGEKLPLWTVAWSLLLLDLPFSFAADTVLLPLTAYHDLFVRGKPKRSRDVEVLEGQSPRPSSP